MLTDNLSALAHNIQINVRNKEYVKKVQMSGQAALSRSSIPQTDNWTTNNNYFHPWSHPNDSIGRMNQGHQVELIFYIHRVTCNYENEEHMYYSHNFCWVGMSPFLNFYYTLPSHTQLFKNLGSAHITLTGICYGNLHET